MNRPVATVALFLLAVVPLATGAQTESSVVGVAGPRVVYLYWGPNGGGPHRYQVYRATGDGSFAKLAEAEPVRDFDAIQRVYESASDPLSRQMSPHPELHQRADERPQLDADFSLISTAHARVRGYAFLDTAVEPGMTYRYRVSKLDAQGGETPLGEVRVTVGAAVRIPPPQVAAAFQAGAPELKWTGPAFTSFEVYRRNGSAAGFERLTVVPVPGARQAGELSFRDSNAVNDGRTYYYQVVPLDLLGQPGEGSRPVAVATADLTPPEPPRELKTAAFPGGVRVNWTAPPDGDDTAGIHLYRTEVAVAAASEGASPATERKRLTATPLAASATSYDDTSAVPGAVYQYEITGIDAQGNESRYSPAVLASPKDSAPPRAPADLRAEAREGGEIRVSWKAGNEPDLYAYRLYQSGGDERALQFAGEVRPEPVGGRITHSLRLDARAQDTFYFAVTAVDRTDNESAKSVVVSARLPDRVPPGVPVITGAQGGDGYIALSWASASDADLKGYFVYRAGEAGAQPTRLNQEPLPATQTEYKDATAGAGTTYHYSVSGVDTAGNESAQSAPVSSSAYKTSRLEAPTGVTARLSEKGIAVSWKAPAQGAFAGFVVFRSEQRDGEYAAASVLLRDAAFLDSAAAPAKTYWYRVVGYDRAGQASAPSDPVTAPAGK